jgi:bifunctional enzyme CysN/CysC
MTWPSAFFKLDHDIAFDPPDLLVATSRFVIVDSYEIAGGGIIEEALTDSLTENREKVHLRNIKWEMGYVEAEERAERNNQKATLILVTGKKEMNRKQVAKVLERKLFEEGKQVYFFSMGNLLYGIDADIKAEVKNNKGEHFRRLAEVANVMLDAGIILVVSVIELTKDDVRQLNMSVDHEKIEVVWLGEAVVTDVDVDLHIKDQFSHDKTVAMIKEYMQKKGIISKPW